MPIRSGGRATAKTARREATRARLIEAARRLFAEHGYSAVSTTEIAREAGVTHGMVSAHFHSKAGLLFELISESNRVQTEAAASVAASEGPFLDRLRRIVEIYLAEDLGDLELYGVMKAYSWRWPYEYERRNRGQLCEALDPLRILLEEAAAGGELRGDVAFDELAAIFLGIYGEATRLAIYEEMDRAEVAEVIMRRLAILADGLRPR
jgi:AcrR family transcriptional regulator